MSYTILQSTKFFRLNDGKGNQVFVYGVVAEDSNCSPKRYDRISIRRAGLRAVDLAMFLVQEVEHIITGSLQIKKPDDKTINGQVDSFVRKFMKNLDNAKRIQVEAINFRETKYGKYADITLGKEAEEVLSFSEPQFYIVGMESVLIHEFKQEENDAFLFITSKNRTIEDACKIVEEQPYIASLYKGRHPTEEQFRKLYKHISGWNFHKFLHNTDEALKKQYMANMTEEEIKDNQW